jgi:hypothetical protein
MVIGTSDLGTHAHLLADQFSKKGLLISTKVIDPMGGRILLGPIKFKAKVIFETSN